MPDLQVGTVLVVVPSDRRSGGPRDCIVARIGRDWVTLTSGGRFRIDDPEMRLVERLMMSPGRCYVSREAYEAARERDRLWVVFSEAVRRDLSGSTYTADQILAAAGALGINVSKPAKAE